MKTVKRRKIREWETLIWTRLHRKSKDNSAYQITQKNLSVLATFFPPFSSLVFERVSKSDTQSVELEKIILAYGHANQFFTCRYNVFGSYHGECLRFVFVSFDLCHKLTNRYIDPSNLFLIRLYLIDPAASLKHTTFMYIRSVWRKHACVFSQGWISG